MRAKEDQTKSLKNWERIDMFKSAKKEFLEFSNDFENF